MFLHSWQSLTHQAIDEALNPQLSFDPIEPLRRNASGRNPVSVVASIDSDCFQHCFKIGLKFLDFVHRVFAWELDPDGITHQFQSACPVGLDDNDTL